MDMPIAIVDVETVILKTLLEEDVDTNQMFLGSSGQSAPRR